MTEQPMNLRSMVATLRRRMGTGLVVGLCVLAAVVTTALVLPDLYRATVVVAVQPAGGADDAAGAVAPADGAVQLNRRLEQVQQTVLSRPSLEQIVRRVKLWPDLQDRGLLDTAMTRVRSALAIESDQTPDSSVAPRALSITYDGTDPDSAAAVANAVAADYVDASDRLQRQSATQASAFLKAQLDSAKGRLSAQNQRIGAYSREHSGELPQQEQANLAVLGRLNGQLQANLASQQQLRQQQLQLQTEVAAGAAGNDIAHSPAAELAGLRRQLAQLQTRFTDQYPDVIRLKQEIASMQATLAANAGAPKVAGPPSAQSPGPINLDTNRQLLAEVGHELEDLKTHETALRSSIGDYEERLQQAPERGQELTQLSRDYTTTSDVYNGLLKQYEQAQLADVLQARATANRLEITEPAQPPRQPIAPNRPLLVAVGVVLAIFAGLVAIFLVDQLDSSFHSVDDLKAFTTLPVLATIPRIVTRRDAWRRRVRVLVQTASVLAVVALIAAASYHVASGSDEIVRLLARVHV